MCKEKEVKMIDIELEFDVETIDHLIEHATKNIVHDEKALINWAVNDILGQIVETDGKILEKEEEDGKGNS